MRIISKFHDYYDIGMSQGQDQSLIYHRTPVEGVRKVSAYYDDAVPFEDETHLNTLMLSDANAISFERVVVGFCGRVYLCYIMGSQVKPYHAPPVEITCCCYNATAVKNFIREYSTKAELKIFHEKPHPWRTAGLNYANIQRRFEEWNTDKYYDEFIRLKAPIFVVRRGNYGRELKLIVNAKLTPFQFYKMVDPYTAYQEIAMFIGGVLGVGEPFMIEIEDKYKIEAKGFNDQSFKTRPGTKPNRKRRKIKDDKHKKMPKL